MRTETSGRREHRYRNCSLGICVLGELQAESLLSIPKCSSRESVRMKSYYYCHWLMVFIFSGLCFLLNGGIVESTRETVYNSREYLNRTSFRRIVTCKSSESGEHPFVSKFNPTPTPSLPNILFEEDYNSTRSRLYRSGLQGAIRRNHLGQPIVRRQWRRNRKNFKNIIKRLNN